ncbi:MAG: hypothetical protein ACRCZP_17455, partial [Phycicoccus sp.]
MPSTSSPPGQHDTDDRPREQDQDGPPRSSPPAPQNPYLNRQREAYTGLRTAIETLQQRALAAGRDLTENELGMVEEQGKAAQRILAEIGTLTEIEVRNAQVAALDAQLAETRSAADHEQDQHRDGQRDGRSNGQGGQQRGDWRTGNTQTRDRDPGHYTRLSAHGFFGDLYHSAMGDDLARTRLNEHNRALATGAAGAGIVPPNWMTEEFELIARQGRRLANVVRRIGLGDDPRPITLPRQTAGTETAVAQQATENTALADVDAWASSTDVVVPKPIAGKQTVSRQMIDMSDPA